MGGLKGSFGKFHGARDKAWKADKLEAKAVAEVGTSTWGRVDLDLQAAARGSCLDPGVQSPGGCLEVLRKWMRLGDDKFQKTFSAEAKRRRFVEHEQITQRHNSRFQKRGYLDR